MEASNGEGVRLRIREFEPDQRLSKGLASLAALGAAIFVLGLFLDPVRAWGGYLMGFTMLTGLVLAGGLFSAVLLLANARWATGLRRVPEAMTCALPWAAGLGLVLLGGVSTLYEWSRGASVEADPILQGKAGYLNWGFFSLRMLLYFGLWSWIVGSMVRASRAQDTEVGNESGKRMVRRAVWFMPVFALTFSLASVDWIQSLEPHWFSTIFALVTLSGLGTSGLAACILLIIGLRRQGALRLVVRDDHLDDLGKIGIGLSLFWGYVWYCQYMLIWYTNMPEETPYYALRMSGNWRVMSFVNLLLNWAIPFFVLMPKAARRSEAVLIRIASIMLVGHVIQSFMLISPALMGDRVSFGIWELGPIAGALALFFWVTLRSLARAPIVPLGDPYLAGSIVRHC